MPSSAGLPFASSEPNSPSAVKKCECLCGSAPRQGCAASATPAGVTWTNSSAAPAAASPNPASVSARTRSWQWITRCHVPTIELLGGAAVAVTASATTKQPRITGTNNRRTLIALLLRFALREPLTEATGGQGSTGRQSAALITGCGGAGGKHPGQSGARRPVRALSDWAAGAEAPAPQADRRRRDADHRR